MNFEVTLKVRVTADSSSDAADWAINASEHLNDTFNDDGAMDPLVGFEVKPVEEQP